MELKQMAEGIYYSTPDHEYDQPCLYAVVGESGVLMIDGGVSPERARLFTGALKLACGRGPTWVAVTHWHWDHTFGLAGIDAPVLACSATAEHLRRMAGYPSWSDEALDARIASGEEISFCADCIKKTYPGEARSSIVIRQPDVVFDGAVTIDLGGVTCRLEMLPKVHTNDSVAIHVPERGTLFIGDSTGQNSYALPAHYSAPAVLKLMDFIRGKGAAVIAESHALPASPAEFHACNGILEIAARGVLGGLHDENSLREHLVRESGGAIPEDLDEIVSLFISGIGR